MVSVRYHISNPMGQPSRDDHCCSDMILVSPVPCNSLSCLEADHCNSIAGVLLVLTFTREVLLSLPAPPGHLMLIVTKVD